MIRKGLIIYQKGLMLEEIPLPSMRDFGLLCRWHALKPSQKLGDGLFMLTLPGGTGFLVVSGLESQLSVEHLFDPELGNPSVYGGLRRDVTVGEGSEASRLPVLVVTGSSWFIQCLSMV